ncbi:MAG: aldo/keto reductase [Anaerolineae bacterium]|nr:aldo/keto reductase [Anaerolineae bacterium]
MKYNRIGNCTMKISEFSYGAYLSLANYGDEDNARALVRTAYEAGINCFDNADEYGGVGNAERLMGKILKDYKRSDLVLTSKCFWDTGPGPNDGGLSRKHIFEQVHQSLRNMQVDYIDIYYAHRYEAAVIGQTDPNLEEAVRAFSDLIHQGKILYWGTSCWKAAQIAHAHAICEKWGLYKPIIEQPQYNMLHRFDVEADLRLMARRLGFGITTWSPLCNGILTGKYNDGIPKDSRLGDPRVAWLKYDADLTPQNIEKVRRLSAIARELGGSMAQLAIAWALRLPEVTSVILGATKVSQLQENLKAVELRDKLTPDVLARIEEILGNNPCPEEEAPVKPSFDF